MARRTPRNRPSTTLAEYVRRAPRYLSQRDPVLKQLIAEVGPFTLRAGNDPFAALVQAVVAQMISSLAARAIMLRLETFLGEVTPARVRAVGADKLKAQGLSRAKAESLVGLAQAVQSGEMPLHRLGEMEDEEIIARLIPLRGIGRWTAEMFLIFSLGRPDVLPIDDFGLRAAVRDLYGLQELPSKAEVRQRAEPWRPYRSVATWYMWKSRGFVPRSD